MSSETPSSTVMLMNFSGPTIQAKNRNYDKIAFLAQIDIFLLAPAHYQSLESYQFSHKVQHNESNWLSHHRTQVSLTAYFSSNVFFLSIRFLSFDYVSECTEKRKTEKSALKFFFVLSAFNSQNC